MTALSIGAVARATGVKVPTIRFYESIGLLPRPARSEGNRRTYGDGDISRLRFIRHARELGFEVDGIRDLLRLSDNPDAPCDDVDAIARAHLERIESKIARLELLRDEVARMVDCCDRGRVADCRVIEVLAEHDHARDAPAGVRDLL